MATTRRTARYDNIGATGDMEYLNSSGLWVPVGGTQATGKVPTKQADGTIQWATPSGGGSGAETLITETELGSAQATFPFTSIVATYRDLRVVIRGRGTTAVNNYCRPRLQFNGDTGSNYDWLRHNTHSSGEERESGTSAAYIDCGILPSSTGPANYQGLVDVRIANYRGTTFYKPVNFHATGTAVGEFYTMNGGGFWKSTSAITSVTVILDAGNFDTGSVCSLYGIL